MRELIARDAEAAELPPGPGDPLAWAGAQWYADGGTHLERRNAMRAQRLALLLVLAFPWSSTAADLDALVEAAIEKGVAFLRQQVEQDAWWDRFPAEGGRGEKEGPFRKGKRGRVARGGAARGQHIMGKTAIELYALIKSDVSVDDSLVSRGFDYLEKLDPVAVYDVSLYLMALDAAWEQRESDLVLLRSRSSARLNPSVTQKLRDRMEELTRWLVEARHAGEGVWNYGAEKVERYDNSNTQFAVLALGVAAKRGIPIGREVWEEIAEHFLAEQAKSGPPAGPSFTVDPLPGEGAGRTAVGRPAGIQARGWPYRPETGTTLNMTAAGLSSLIIAREYLGGKGKAVPQAGQKIDQAIWDGLAQLARTELKYERKQLYYGLYSVEKVGDLGAITKVGPIDWYRQGAELLLGLQRKEGSWGNEGQNHERNFRFQTSFALLFLNRATDLLLHARPMVLTGKGSTLEPRTGFMYVSRLGGEVSLARLFRKLRYRPAADLLPLLEAVVAEAEKRNRAADLVPYLIGLAESPNRRLEEFARKGLRQATGERHDDLAAHKAWAEAWRAATEIGTSKDAGRAGELRKLLSQAKSYPLKNQILWALERCVAREAIGDLIGELSDANAKYRARAYEALKFISGKDFPFDPSGPVAGRKEGIALWLKWHESEAKASGVGGGGG